MFRLQSRKHKIPTKSINRNKLRDKMAPSIWLPTHWNYCSGNGLVAFALLHLKMLVKARNLTATGELQPTNEVDPISVGMASENHPIWRRKLVENNRKPSNLEGNPDFEPPPSTASHK